MVARNPFRLHRILLFGLFTAMGGGSATILVSAFGIGGLTLDQGAALMIVGFSKWIALMVAGCASSMCASRLASRSWYFLAGGLCLYAAGQSTLAYFQLFLGRALTFPSPADVFFICGLLVIAASLCFFLMEWTRSGFPIELKRRAPRVIAIVLGVGGAVCWLMLGPLLPIRTLDLKSVLSLLYPLADLLLLVPLVLLQQATRSFRGGGIWRAWTVLLAGFALLLIGDLSFAVLLESYSIGLAVVVDGCFLLGYSWVAWACLLQLEMLD